VCKQRVAADEVADVVFGEESLGIQQAGKQADKDEQAEDAEEFFHGGVRMAAKSCRFDGKF